MQVIVRSVLQVITSTEVRLWFSRRLFLWVLTSWYYSPGSHRSNCSQHHLFSHTLSEQGVNMHVTVRERLFLLGSVMNPSLQLFILISFQPADQNVNENLRLGLIWTVSVCFFLCVWSRQCAARSWSCWARTRLTTTSGRWPSSARTASTGSSRRSRRPRRSRASSTLTTRVRKVCRPQNLLREDLGVRFAWWHLNWSVLFPFCTDAFDNDLIIATLWDIKEGKTVHIPVYDFVSHSRWTHRRH